MKIFAAYALVAVGAAFVAQSASGQQLSKAEQAMMDALMARNEQSKARRATDEEASLSVKKGDVIINTRTDLAIETPDRQIRVFETLDSMEAQTAAAATQTKSDLASLAEDVTATLEELARNTTSDLATAADQADEMEKALKEQIRLTKVAADTSSKALEGKVTALKKSVDEDVASALADLKKKSDADIAKNLKEITALKKGSDAGTKKDAAVATCEHILLANPAAANGKYYIDPNGGSKSDAFQVYCDMGNGGIIQIEATSATKKLTHKHYGRSDGKGGDGWSWQSKMKGHNGKTAAFEIASTQLAALHKMASSASQGFDSTCNGAMLFGYVSDGTGMKYYSGAARFKSAAGSFWSSPYQKQYSELDFDPYLSYVVGTDTCKVNKDAVLGKTDFTFQTKQYRALPVVDFEITDYGDGNEKHGGTWGPVRFVAPARPKAGETFNTAVRDCREIKRLRPDATDGQYFVKPLSSEAPTLVKCDFTCSNPMSPCRQTHAVRPFNNAGEVVEESGTAWTCIPVKRQIPFQNWYNRGDRYAWFSKEMNVRRGWPIKYAMSDKSMKQLQKTSSQATQMLTGHCRDAIMWGYGNRGNNWGNGYGYATRFKGMNGANFRYNYNNAYRPNVLNDEDYCGFNNNAGREGFDRTIFRFQNGDPYSLPIIDFQVRDHGSNGEWTGMTFSNVCFN